MYCAKVTRQLQLYIDKRLTLEQTRSLEYHLSTCSACCKEYFLLQEIEYALNHMEMVREPANLTINIMARVALNPQQSMVQARQHANKPVEELQVFVLLKPSLPEMLTAIVLATVAMFAIMLEQPSLRTIFFVGSGHDPLSVFVTTTWHVVSTTSSDTLMACFWIIGTLLGVWVTLAVAGSDVRSEWYQAVLDHLPVW